MARRPPVRSAACANGRDQDSATVRPLGRGAATGWEARAVPEVRGPTFAGTRVVFWSASQRVQTSSGTVDADVQRFEWVGKLIARPVHSGWSAVSLAHVPGYGLKAGI